MGKRAKLVATGDLAYGRPMAPWRAVAAAAGLVHLALIARSGALRWDYLVLDGLLLGFLATRRLGDRIFGAVVPAWMTVVLYLDVQGTLLLLRGRIHTGDLFAIDAALFPAPSAAGPLPWPAWFAANPSVLLDLVCGVAYAAYLLPFFGTFFVSLASDLERARAIAWCFFGANVLAIGCFMLYPAAPPWYVLDHGGGPADLGVLPSAAGAARFDALLGIELFARFYSRNPNVFGATPSLHVAYAVMAAWHLWRHGPFARAFGVLFSLLMGFSAVYLAHHYVLDVFGGVATGLITCAVVDRAFAALRRARSLRREGESSSRAAA